MNQASNRLTVVLGAALVIALMTIAFLLGRESKPPVTSERVIVEAPGAPEVAERLPPPPRSPEPPLVAPEVSSDPAPAVAPSPADGTSVAQVVAYFAKVDRIQAGPNGLSADAFAQQLIADASAGKAEGFDALFSDLDRMSSELAAITPPEPCRAYHQLSISAVSDARTMVGSLRDAFNSGDMSKLGQLSAQAQASQATAKQLEAERAAIEKRYQLKR